MSASTETGSEFFDKTAENMQAPNLFQADNMRHSMADMDREDKAWENANNAADEMDKEELRSGIIRTGSRMANFNM